LSKIKNTSAWLDYPQKYTFHSVEISASTVS
jgi:hypothetical protein